MPSLWANRRSASRCLRLLTLASVVFARLSFAQVGAPAKPADATTVPTQAPAQPPLQVAPTPAYPQPAPPAYPQPAFPAYPQPASPVYPQPAPPAYQQPASPVYPQPAPPAYPQPAPQQGWQPQPQSYPPPYYQPQPQFCQPCAGLPPQPYPQPRLAQPMQNTVAASAASPAAERPKRFLFGATLATTFVSETNSLTNEYAPLLEAAVALHRQVLLDLAWGFAWAIDGQGLSESTWRSGNPMLSGMFRMNLPQWRFRGGIGITAPAAHVPRGNDGRLYAFAYNHAMAMWGMWNQWLWSPERMAIPVYLNAGYQLAGQHLLVLDAAIAPLIGVRGDASGTETVGQLSLEARLSITELFSLCPRVQGVLLPSAGLDRLQTAFGLRATMDTRAGRIFAGFLVNLDAPLGIWGGLARWGIQLGKEIDL